jgi:dephospho-CoA kinase
MVKVLITGSSTVGKSTVAAELKRRGFTAIDGDDEPGLVRLEVKQTGEAAEWPEGYVDWSYYSWNLQQPTLNKVLARDQTVFLIGIYGNQPDYYSLFDKIIVLTITPEEYNRRLQNRLRRTVGDSDKNMADRAAKYPILLQRFLDAGAVPVNASGSVDETVNAILMLVKDEH